MITRIKKSVNSIFCLLIVARLFFKVAIQLKKMPGHLFPKSRPASFAILRQPGYLFETRGFPSPSHEEFGFIVRALNYFYKDLLSFLANQMPK